MLAVAFCNYRCTSVVFSNYSCICAGMCFRIGFVFVSGQCGQCGHCTAQCCGQTGKCQSTAARRGEQHHRRVANRSVQCAIVLLYIVQTSALEKITFVYVVHCSLFQFVVLPRIETQCCQFHVHNAHCLAEEWSSEEGSWGWWKRAAPSVAGGRPENFDQPVLVKMDQNYCLWLWLTIFWYSLPFLALSSTFWHEIPDWPEWPLRLVHKL